MRDHYTLVTYKHITQRSSRRPTRCAACPRLSLVVSSQDRVRGVNRMLHKLLVKELARPLSAGHVKPIGARVRHPYTDDHNAHAGAAPFAKLYTPRGTLHSHTKW